MSEIKNTINLLVTNLESGCAGRCRGCAGRLGSWGADRGGRLAQRVTDNGRAAGRWEASREGSAAGRWGADRSAGRWWRERPRGSTRIGWGRSARIMWGSVVMITVRLMAIRFGRTRREWHSTRHEWWRIRREWLTTRSEWRCIRRE